MTVTVNGPSRWTVTLVSLKSKTAPLPNWLFMAMSGTAGMWCIVYTYSTTDWLRTSVKSERETTPDILLVTSLLIGQFRDVPPCCVYRFAIHLRQSPWSYNLWYRDIKQNVWYQTVGELQSLISKSARHVTLWYQICLGVTWHLGGKKLQYQTYFLFDIAISHIVTPRRIFRLRDREKVEF